jgi:hypothetical protein
MEFVARDVNRPHLEIGDLHAFRIPVGVDLTANLQAGFRGDRADQLNNDLGG